MKSKTREFLIVPAICGALFGSLVGFASFGFDMEYGPSIHPSWHPLWLFASAQALLAYTITASVIVLLFGIIPLLTRRAHNRVSDRGDR